MGREAQARRPIVLVVEEEAEARARLARELTLGGFTVWLACGGREALATCRRHRGAIDLVLLGVGLPGLDGSQTLAALRQIAPDVRVVFLGADRAHTREELLGLGADLVLDSSAPSAAGMARSLWRLLPARR